HGPGLEQIVELRSDELCPRRQEEQRLRSRIDLVLRIEQQGTDGVPDRTGARLAKRDGFPATLLEPAEEPGKLSALARSLHAFEDDEAPALPSVACAVRSAHPRVMIGLAAPFRIPSRI